MKIKPVLSFTLASLLIALSGMVSVQAKDVPGATQTSYGVSSSGAFQFSIPIVVPQGRNGVTPSLSIGYSSSGGNGSMGVGWGLSGFSAITRCGKTFATEGQRGGVQHNANDRFCLNGQKLILVSGTYGVVGSEYRTEIDRFSKIVATGTNAANINGGTAPSSWKVWSKGGQIYHYGAPEGVSAHTAQFRLPGISSIHSWKLARVSDRSGNYYENHYRSEDGLPTEIRYNGSTTRKITINYETRPDARFAYVQGRRINRNVRVKDVTVVNGGTWLGALSKVEGPNGYLQTLQYDQKVIPNA